MRLRTGTISVWVFVTTTLAAVVACAALDVTAATSGWGQSASVPTREAMPEVSYRPASFSSRVLNPINMARRIDQNGDRQVGSELFRDGLGLDLARIVMASEATVYSNLKNADATGAYVQEDYDNLIWLPLVARNHCPPGQCWCPQNDPNLTGKTVFALAGCEDGTLFAGAEDGIYRRGPSDIEWKPEESTTGEVRGLVAHSECTDVYAAVLDQGVLRRDEGSWSLVSTSEMTRARTVALSGGKVLAGGDFGVSYSVVGPVHQWQSISTRFDEKRVTNLVRSDGWIYAAVWCGGAWRCNENNLYQWQPTGLNKRCALQAIGSPVDGAPRFVGLNDGFYRWTGTELDPDWEKPEPWGTVRTFCFAIDGATAYAGQEESGVLRSTDGGVSWEPMSTGWGTPPFQVRTLLIHIDDGGRRWLYAGTTEGVWRYLLP